LAGYALSKCLKKSRDFTGISTSLVTWTAFVEPKHAEILVFSFTPLRVLGS